jgi:hypothetical protein
VAQHDARHPSLRDKEVGGGGRGEEEDDAFLRDRDPEEALYSMALGYCLFSCPTVIMAFVQHWMTWNHHTHQPNARSPLKASTSLDEAMAIEDSTKAAFTTFCEAILGSNPDLYLIMRNKNDVTRAQTRASFDLGTMNLNANQHTPSDYTLNREVLLSCFDTFGAVLTPITAATAEGGEEEEDEDEDEDEENQGKEGGEEGRDGADARRSDPRPTWRFLSTIAHLLTEPTSSPSLFATTDTSVDGVSFTLRSYRDNDLLNICYDRSAFFIALGVFLSDYIQEVTERDDAASRGDAALVDSRGYLEAGLEAGKQLLICYGNIIEHLHGHVTKLHNASRAIPFDARLEKLLSTYEPSFTETEQNAHHLLRGIPIEILQSEPLTLLWLHETWKTHVMDRGMPIRTLLLDVWRAKSAVLMARYKSFFEGNIVDEGEEDGGTSTGFDQLLFKRFGALGKGGGGGGGGGARGKNDRDPMDLS